MPTSPGSLRIAKEVKSIRADILLGYRKHRAENSKSGRGVIIKSDHTRSVMEVLGAIADTSGEVLPVALRAAQVDDGRRVVLDLGDATGQVVEVTRDGYRVTEQTDDMPLFRRTAATAALPGRSPAARWTPCGTCWA